MVQGTEKKLNDLEKNRQSPEKEIEDVRKEMEVLNGELDKNKTILARYNEKKELKKKGKIEER